MTQSGKPTGTRAQQDHGAPGTLREVIDATTVADLRARGSFKWAAPGPDGFGAAVAEMDFGAAPPILEALAELSADARFGCLPPPLADELAAVTADFECRRFGWEVDPALVHPLPDVIKVLELAITQFSRPGSPVILPVPAYMPSCRYRLSSAGSSSRSRWPATAVASSPSTSTRSRMPSGPAPT